MKMTSYRNYQARIEGYGFGYHPVHHTMRFLGCLVSIIAFSLYFQMNVVLLCILITGSILLLPLCFLWQYEYVFEERLFKEYTMMIQQIAASFKINPKIIHALQEVLPLCSGSLQVALDSCIAAMEQGKGYEVAMKSLEEKYPFFVLKNMNTLMITVEVFGARRFQDGLDLIQDDLDDVIEDMYLHQQELVQTKNKVFILCLLAIVVAVLSKQMLSDLFDFKQHLVYQLSLFLFVGCLLASIVLAQRAMRHTWLVWGNRS